MRFDTLADWLKWQETLHPSEIELGLERVSQVYARVCENKLSSHIITIAGTNGKGTSLALLEQIYLAAGFSVGSYSSPHLYRYNERIKINGEPVSDEALCAAFDKIDQARVGTSDSSGKANNISLTYFEFGTLAAFSLFHAQQPDVVILEVGMGGRLDAVNLLDADIALITSVALDHQQWLGNTREEIAYEKAGIMRPMKPVVYADIDCPDAIIDFARSLSAPLFRLNTHFHCDIAEAMPIWHWHNEDTQIRNLPRLNVQGDQAYKNGAAVLQVIMLSQPRLPVSHQAIRLGMHAMRLPGRLEIINTPVMQIFDVAHNDQSIRHLANWLQQNPVTGQTFAVFGMMADKLASIDFGNIGQQIDAWYVSRADIARAAEPELIREKIRLSTQAATISCHATLSQAYAAAHSMAQAADRVVVFGSFYTVAQTRPESI